MLAANFEKAAPPESIRQAAGSWRGRIALLAMTAAVSLGAHDLLSPASADADCVTTQTVESVTTICGPDVGQPEQPPAEPSQPQPPKHSPKHSPKPHDQDYHNPFVDEILNGSLKPYRIDEGVDYRGHGNVYPIGPAVVTQATNHSSFFANEGGQNTVYRLTSGKARGKSIFVGEACKPRPGLIGHKVTAETVICRMHADSFPGIETGWWNPHTDKPMAWPSYTPAGNPDGSKTAYGVNFSQLLESLGVPGGNSIHRADHMSTNPGRKVGHLPRNWPRW